MAEINPKELIGAKIIDIKVSEFGVHYFKLEKDGKVFTVCVDGPTECIGMFLRLVENDDWVWSDED